MTYTCGTCGKREPWDKKAGWHWYPGIPLVWCSDECSDAYLYGEVEKQHEPNPTTGGTEGER